MCMYMYKCTYMYMYMDTPQYVALLVSWRPSTKSKPQSRWVFWPPFLLTELQRPHTEIMDHYKYKQASSDYDPKNQQRQGPRAWMLVLSEILKSKLPFAGNWGFDPMVSRAKPILAWSSLTIWFVAPASISRVDIEPWTLHPKPQSLNAKPKPQSQRIFRCRWASPRSEVDRVPSPQSSEDAMAARLFPCSFRSLDRLCGEILQLKVPRH